MIEVPNVKYQLTFASDTSPILEILYFKINKKNLFSDIFIPWKRISFNVDNVIFIWYSFVLCWVEEKQTFSFFRQQNILLKYRRSYLAFRTESLWFHFVKYFLAFYFLYKNYHMLLSSYNGTYSISFGLDLSVKKHFPKIFAFTEHLMHTKRLFHIPF